MFCAGPDPTKPVLNLVGVYPVVSMGLLSRTFRMCVARRRQLTKLCMCFRVTLCSNPHPHTQSWPCSHSLASQVSNQAACLHRTGLQIW